MYGGEYQDHRGSPRTATKCSQKSFRRSLGGLQNKSRYTIVVVVLTIAIILGTDVLLHILFGMEFSKLTLKMLATLIAVVMTVASVAVTLFFQSEYEVDREFKTDLFKRRIDVYYKLLLAYSEKKADGEIDAEKKQTC